MANFNDFPQTANEKLCYIKKVSCSSYEYSLGIAKHPYIHTERQPTCMSRPLCPYIHSIDLAILTNI